MLVALSLLNLILLFFFIYFNFTSILEVVIQTMELDFIQLKLFKFDKFKSFSGTQKHFLEAPLGEQDENLNHA